MFTPLSVLAAAILGSLFFTVPQVARALGMEITTVTYTLNSNRPDELQALSGDHFYRGYCVNQDDVFFYRGDAEALNAFLQKYAKLTCTRDHVLKLEPGKPRVRTPWPNKLTEEQTECDWEMSVVFLPWRVSPPGNLSVEDPHKYRDRILGTKKFEVTVTVYEGGKTKWKDIVVSDNVLARH